VVPEPVVPEPVVPMSQPETPVELPPLVASTPPAPAAAPEPEPAPVPALKPVEVAHVAAPRPTAEPVVAEAEPVVEAAPEPVYSQVEPELKPEVDVRADEELPTAVSYDVSLRLSDGERVAVGSFGDPQKAREYAREVVRHLSEEGEGWPFFSGRFMRPDTIVSVDIVPVGEPDRWLGSSIRSNWASRLNR
jgi:hypothetical protein